MNKIWWWLCKFSRCDRYHPFFYFNFLLCLYTCYCLTVLRLWLYYGVFFSVRKKAILRVKEISKKKLEKLRCHCCVVASLMMYLLLNFFLILFSLSHLTLVNLWVVDDLFWKSLWSCEQGGPCIPLILFIYFYFFTLLLFIFFSFFDNLFYLVKCGI